MSAESVAMSNAEVRDVLSQLRQNKRHCAACRRCLINTMADRAEVQRLARAAARYDKDLTARLTTARSALANAVDTALIHLAEPHDEPPAETPKPKRRVAAPDDRVKCPSCGGKAKERGPGRIGGHKSPSGQSCPRRLLSIDVGDVPVVLPEQNAPPVTPAGGHSDKAGRFATGRCHECDRPISGERWYCGRCLAKRRL